MLNLSIRPESAPHPRYLPEPCDQSPLNHLKSRERDSVARAALNPTSTLHSPTSGDTTHPVLTCCFQQSCYCQPDEFADWHVRVPSCIDQSRVSFLAQHPERDRGTEMTVIYNSNV